MRIILILLVSLLLLSILFLSDFFLSNLIRKKIEECNTESAKHAGFTAISPYKTAFFASLFWLIPLSLLPESLKLEYRVGATLLYWLLLSFSLFTYLHKRTTSQLAKKSLPFWLTPAFLSGFLFVPIFVLLKDFFA